MASPIAPWAALGLLGSSAEPQIQQIRQAAEGFERVILRQMLQNLRASSLQDSESVVSRGFSQIGDDHLAEHLAKAGGLGVGQAMAKQMLQQVKAAQLIESSQKAVNTNR
jgi:Rod binding domain-containing protein